MKDFAKNILFSLCGYAASAVITYVPFYLYVYFGKRGSPLAPYWIGLMLSCVLCGVIGVKKIKRLSNLFLTLLSVLLIPVCVLLFAFLGMQRFATAEALVGIILFVSYVLYIEFGHSTIWGYVGYGLFLLPLLCLCIGIFVPQRPGETED